MKLEVPETTIPISEAFHLFGRHVYGDAWASGGFSAGKFPEPVGGAWTSEEISARRLPEPEELIEAISKANDDPTALEDLISYFCFGIKLEFERWPDPDSKEYKSEYAAFLRFDEIHPKLHDLLRSGHVGSWFVSSLEEQIKIPHYYWAQPGRILFGAGLCPLGRSISKLEFDEIKISFRDDKYQDPQYRKGVLLVDLIKLQEFIDSRKNGLAPEEMEDEPLSKREKEKQKTKKKMAT